MKYVLKIQNIESEFCTYLKLQPRRWRRTLSLAIDAFRHMLRMEEELTIRALLLTALERLALNCPRCFGPLQPNDDPDVPDYVVCVDGNFQHRRHRLASKEYEERELAIPSLFIDPKKVAEWEPRAKQIKEKSQPVVCNFVCYFHRWLFLNHFCNIILQSRHIADPIFLFYRTGAHLSTLLLLTTEEQPLGRHVTRLV